MIFIQKRKSKLSELISVRLECKCRFLHIWIHNLFYSRGLGCRQRHFTCNCDYILKTISWEAWKGSPLNHTHLFSVFLKDNICFALFFPPACVQIDLFVKWQIWILETCPQVEKTGMTEHKEAIKRVWLCFLWKQSCKCHPQSSL